MKKIMMIAAFALIAPLTHAEDMAPAVQNSADAAYDDTSAAAVEVIEITEVETAEVETATETGTAESE